MNLLAQYVLMVIAAALVAAIFDSLAGQGTMGKVIRLLSGLFLALTILSPLVQLQLPDWQQWSGTFAADGEITAAEGLEMAREAEASIITEQLEAYIEDKAAACGCSLEARVRLGDDGIPTAVVLKGECSTDDRKVIGRLITDELGIGEEAQQWTG